VKRIVLGLALRRLATRSALVNQNDAIDRGVKEPAAIKLTATARAAMKKNNRQSGGVTALIDIKIVQRINL